LEDTPGRRVDRKVSIATGLAAAEFLRGLCQKAEKQFPGLQVTVWPVENRLFGKHITVAGLVCGSDIIHTLQGKEIGQEVLIPESMLRREGDMLLDDLTPAQIAEKLGVPVTPVAFGGQPLLDALLGE